MKKNILILFAICSLFYSCNLVEDNSSSIDLNSPGNYRVGKSYTVDIPIYNASVDVEVTSIKVFEDLKLGVEVIWTMNVSPGYSITKYSDDGNYNMNLTDNLGNIYYMTNTLGAAGYSITLEDGESCSGTFVYPEPYDGISTLHFNDEDSNKSLSIRVTK